LIIWASKAESAATPPIIINIESKPNKNFLDIINI
jgi:hypothetical protein